MATQMPFSEGRLLLLIYRIRFWRNTGDSHLNVKTLAVIPLFAL
jgi:hypothetical protein